MLSLVVPKISIFVACEEEILIPGSFEYSSEVQLVWNFVFSAVSFFSLRRVIFNLFWSFICLKKAESRCPVLS